MATTRKRATIDEKIAVAQEQVVRAKARYDKAAHELKVLLEKRDAMRRDELWGIVVKSDLSYDQIIALLKAKNTDDDDV
jgi:hypothetical protein